MPWRMCARREAGTGDVAGIAGCTCANDTELSNRKTETHFLMMDDSRTNISAKNGQRSNSLLRRCINCIAQRRRNWRHRRFANSSRSLGARNRIHLDCRSFFHPQRSVVVEVALYDAALIDRDLRSQRVAQCIHDSTLNLLFHDAWVYHLSAVDHGDDAMYSRLVLLHSDLDHLRHVRRKAAETSDAAVVARGKRRVPSSFFGGKLQHRAHASRVPCRREILQVLILRQEMQPELQRIFPR